MKKIVTVAMVTGSALALSACDPNPAETPAEPMASDAMAPATPDAVDPAEAAAEGIDETSNPIRPAQAVDGNEMTPSAE